MGDKRHAHARDARERPSAEDRPGGNRESTARRDVSVRISDAAGRQEVAALKRQISRDPQKGVDLLRRAGIITTTGKLSKDFGGK